VDFRYIRSIDREPYPFRARNPNGSAGAVPNRDQYIRSITKSQGPRSQHDQKGAGIQQDDFVAYPIERLAPPAGDRTAVAAKSAEVGFAAAGSYASWP